MASGTKPHTVFLKVIHRAEQLIELRATQPEIDEPDDLLRAAVVLAVAAFDRYFTAKYCDVLVPHLKSGKKIYSSLFETLGKAGLTPEFTLQEIIPADRPYRKIRTIIQNSLSNYTSHRDDKIDELFSNVGLKNLCENAQAKAKRKNLLSRVMKLVDLRNEIAHEAHTKTNGDPRHISSDNVSSRINEMKLFVKCCDEIIDKKFGAVPSISA